MKSDARDGDSDVGKGSCIAVMPAAYGRWPTDSLRCVPHVEDPVGPRWHRSGPFVVGDIVQLTDPKGRMHTITLEPGLVFHTSKGGFPHDDLIGMVEGSIVNSANGTPYVALRPHLDDFVLSMPRGAQVIYPKDSARIMGLANLGPGSRVAEAGVGSGALTCSLLRAVGPTGQVFSYERREDFAEVARRNVARWFVVEPSSWTLTLGDLSEALAERDLDAVVLDMLAPWECVEAVARALAPGGTLIAYVATTTQLSRFVETIRVQGGWTEPRAEETLMRTWHLEGLAVRPQHRMNGHTGFLVTMRRLAPGAQLPPRRRRPAPGAYGEDYTGPGSGGEA